jgi:hypothetical protein
MSYKPISTKEYGIKAMNNQVGLSDFLLSGVIEKGSE